MSTPTKKNTICPQCNVDINIATLETSKCPNCNSELGTLIKANQLKSSNDSKIKPSEDPGIKPKTGNKQIDSFRELISNKLFSVTIIGTVGLILIAFAFTQIISSLEYSLPLYYISVGSFILFSVLLMLTVYFVSSERFEPFSVFLLLMVAELLLFSSNYYVDINSSSSFNRHLILSVAVIFAILVILSSSFIVDPKFDSIHRVTLIYLSWLIILHVAGHEYISNNTLTLVIALLIILFHFSILRVPVTSVLLTALILEFLILIQTRIINSVNYGILAFLTIISIPVIAIILDFRTRSSKDNNLSTSVGLFNYEISRNMLFTLFQIPQIAIVIGIVSGGTNTPISELLIGSYCVIWVAYLQFHKKVLKEDISFFKQQSFIISIIMIVSISILSTNTSGLAFYSLLIAVIALVLFLKSNVDLSNQMKIQTLGILSNGFITANLVLNANLSSYIALILFLILSFIYFSFEILKRRELNDYMLYSIWIAGALMLSYLFSKDPESVPVGVMLEYNFMILLLLLISLKFRGVTKMKRDLFGDDLTPITISFAFALPFNIFLTDLSDQVLKYWVLLATSLIIASFIFLRHRHFKIQMIVISYLLLILPLIFSLTIYENEIYSSLVTLYSLIVSVFIFIIFRERQATDHSDYLLQYSVHLFLAISVLSKFVTLPLAKIKFLDVRYGDLILIITYLTWVSYILFEYVSLNNQKIRNLGSLIFGFGANYIIFLQIVFPTRFEFSETVLHVLYFANQLLILGIIYVIGLRKLLFTTNIDRFYLFQISIIGIEIVTLITFDFTERILYHALLILLIFKEIKEKNDFQNQRIAIIWIVVVEITLISFGNYGLITIPIMLSLVFASLLFPLKPRLVIESLANINNNPLKTLVYESSILMFIYLVLIILSRQIFGLLIGYSLFQLFTIVYLIYNYRRENKLTNLVSLNLFVIVQFYWASEVLRKTINYHIGFLISYFALLVFAIYYEKDHLLTPRKAEGRLFYDWPALGIASALILFILETSYMVSYILGLDSAIYNQYLGIVLLLTSGIIFSTENKIQSSNLLDGVIISSFIVGLGLTLFAFFNSVISNLVISLIVLFFIIMFIFNKSADILNVAKSLFVITLIKGVIDLYILTSLQRGISILMVGINGVLFALILQSPRPNKLQDN